MTASERRALTILQMQSKPIRPHAFALLMWPDSPRWKTSYHVGYGATAGAAVWRSAGAYLGKLKKKGYARDVYGIRDRRLWEGVRITAAGELALKKASS